ncbi:MAG: DUF1572 family protein [Saprospiraceae bacterium]|nr:DUF1572 family protein [Saprospiraceae bacterium]
MKQYLIHFYQQHLQQLRNEISAYKNEADLWIVAPGISNSGGNLCCHLLGNLNHFIGTALGDTGYQRNRDLEFSIKNVPQAELLQNIDATIIMIGKVINEIEDFEKDYPENFFPTKNTIGFYLLHLLAHLNYHLGQVNYHRRLLSTNHVSQ